MTTPSLSVRLSEDVRVQLDRAAKSTCRSRSFLVQEALMRHLKDIVAEQGASPAQNRLDKLRALKGAGARMYGPRSVEEIEAQIRALRGDDE